MKVRNDIVLKQALRAKPSPGGQQWETKRIIEDYQSLDLVNEAGAQGWELVSVVREAGFRTIYYLKRRRP